MLFNHADLKKLEQRKVSKEENKQTALRLNYWLVQAPVCSDAQTAFMLPKMSSGDDLQECIMIAFDTPAPCRAVTDFPPHK